MPSTSEYAPPRPHYLALLEALGTSGMTAKLTPELANLLDEHHDLDTVITVLLEAGSDDLLVSRFKKRKLHLKDQIAAAVAQLHDPQVHAA